MVVHFSDLSFKAGRYTRSYDCLRFNETKITEKDNPFRKEALMGYMQVLTYNTYKYLIHHEENSKIEKERKSRQQEIYDSFIKEIQKNYTKERSISYYADLLCITPKYLSQVVRKVSGRFAGDWINDFVILT